MHPATLGQSIDELRRMDLVTVKTDPRDRRARLVGLTEAGIELVAKALMPARPGCARSTTRWRGSIG